MKIIITGGSGFLGRHVVWRAAREQAEVIFTGRNGEAAASVIAHAAHPVKWQPLEHGSPQARDVLNALTKKADAVIHCAALSSPWGDPAVFHRTNVIGTEEVIAACRVNHVPRLIHISTPSLYFDFKDRHSIREDAPLPPPVNHYVATKRLAEERVRAANLPEAVILRPRALFGPWDETLLPRLLRVMRRGGVPLMRGGNILLDLTYVDNAVDAVWLALTRPLPRPLCCYNVTNDEPRPLIDLLHTMAEAFALPLRTRRIPWPLVAQIARMQETVANLYTGKEPTMTRYSAGVLAFSQTLDVRAIRNELGWHAQIPLDEGIARHAAWWKGRQQ